MLLEHLCHESKIFSQPNFDFDLMLEPIFDVDEIPLNDDEEILENLKIIFWLSDNAGEEKPKVLSSKHYFPVMAAEISQKGLT